MLPAQLRLGMLYAIVLVIVVPALVAAPPPQGSSGGGKGKPGIGGGGPPPAGAEGAGGGEPDPETLVHPNPPNTTLDPMAPPNPNLVVTLLHPSKNATQVGTGITFYVVVENVGFRWWNDTWVHLIDETAAVGVGSANVTLTDFRGSASFAWTASGLGNHTFRAVADLPGAVEETNETDNDATVVVEVTFGAPIGRPDLEIRPIQLVNLTDVEANTTALVDVTVRNLGDAPASGVVVEVWEDERSLLVDNFTIAAGAGGQAVHTVSWTPDVAGPKHLTVRVDPYGARDEHNESNNEATEGFDIRPAGTLSIGDPPHILPWCPRAIVWGDWYIPAGTSVWVYNCFVRVYGDVRVAGSLTLTNVTVELAATTNNQYEVDVQSGGFLGFNGSDLTAFRGSYGISARAEAGCAFEFHSSSIARWLYGDLDPTVPGGLQVYTSSVLLQNSTVWGSQGSGVYVGPGVDAQTVSGNMLIFNAGAGIAFAPGSTANLSANELGWNRFGVHIWDASPALSLNIIHHNFYGVFQYYRSSATLSGNAIQRNDVGILLSNGWDRPMPALSAVLVEDSARVGILALLSNLTLTASTVRNDKAAVSGGVGVAVDFLTYHAPPTTAPRIEDTLVLGYSTTNNANSYLTYSMVVRGVPSVTVAGSEFRVSVRGSWIIDSGATVGGNDWIWGWTQLVAVRSTVVGSWNTFSTYGHISVVSIRAEDSTLSSANDSFLVGCSAPASCKPVLVGVLAEDSLVNVDGALFNDTKTGVALFNGTAQIEDSDFLATNETVGGPTGTGIASRNATAVILSNRFEHYRYGIYSSNSSVDVRNNGFLHRYFHEDYPWVWNPNSVDYPDRGHIAVYAGSAATIRNNTFFGGAWGITVERKAGEPGALSAATVEDNAFDRVGYVGVGITIHSTAVVRRNVLANASFLALYDESALSAEVFANTVTRCHGRLGVGFTRGCIGYLYAPSQVQSRPPGWLNATWNNVTGANWTGIDLIGDGHVFLGDNVVRAREGWNATLAGVILEVPTLPATMARNEVRGFWRGVWVKRPGAASPTDPGHDLGPDNVIADNTDGVLVGYGNVANAYTWADIHGNTIANNTNGVNVSSAVEAFAVYPGRATLTDNRIENNSVGVLVRTWINRTDVPAIEPHVNATGNRVANNTHGVHLESTAIGGSTYYVWANLTDNNTVSGNAYGVWIDADTTNLSAGTFWLWWNDLTGNTAQGVHVEGTLSGPDYFWAKCNWWGHDLGPYDPTDPFTGPPDENQNLDPNAQYVSDYFRYRDPLGASPRRTWLNNSSDAMGTICLTG